jgi:hypothetical protein
MTTPPWDRQQDCGFHATLENFADMRTQIVGAMKDLWPPYVRLSGWHEHCKLNRS